MCATITAEPGKRLEAIQVGAVSADRLPGEVSYVVARLVRVEPLDEAERDIGQRSGDENAPDRDGHEDLLFAEVLTGSEKGRLALLGCQCGRPPHWRKPAQRLPAADPRSGPDNSTGAGQDRGSPDFSSHALSCAPALRRALIVVVAFKPALALACAGSGWLVHRFDENDHIGPILAICDAVYC